MGWFMQRLAAGISMLLIACQPGKDESAKGTGGDDGSSPSTGSDSGESYDPSTATLTISYDYEAPVTLLKNGVTVAVGFPGDAFTVGEGKFDLLLGPYDHQSDTDNFPEDDAYTGDGLAMIVIDDRRFLFRGSVEVDQRAETVAPEPLMVLGEGTYKCEWTKREYNEYNDYHYGGEWEDEAESIEGYVSLVDGKYLVPEDGIAGYMGMLSDGDRIVVMPDSDVTPYNTTIGLVHVNEDGVESESPNSLRNVWLEGRGVADFGGIYIVWGADDATHEDDYSYQWACRRDWSAYTAQWYREHGGD